MTTLSIEDFKNEVGKVQSFLTENELLPSVINKDDSSIMFPPIPSNPFPDAYPEEGYPDGRPKQEKQQVEYESEVKVFRALENLKHGLVVMQSFEYTSGQNMLFRNNKGTSKSGQSDFVIVGVDFCVILEVKRLMGFSWFIENSDTNVKKSPEDRRKFALKRHLRDGREQGFKTLNIITDMLKLFNHETRVSNTIIIDGLDREEAKTILCEDDTATMFDLLFIGGSTSKPCSSQDLEDHLSDLFRTTSENMVGQEKLPILTLWSMNGNNECKLSDFDLCDLIQKIDRKLRISRITTNIKKNPRVEGPPDIFKRFLGIENLTAEQKKIFRSPEKILEISGPAGSGKTIVMLGKIIEIALKENSPKSLLIVANEEQVTRCAEIIQNKAGIKTVTDHISRHILEIMSRMGYDQFLYEEIVTNSDPDVKVIIVEAPLQLLGRKDHSFAISLLKFLEKLSRADNMINVFIDDNRFLQKERYAVIGGDCSREREYEMIVRLAEFRNCHLWTTVDQYQDCVMICDGMMPRIPLKNSLTLNIRNSISIASFSVFLREAIHCTVYREAIERHLQGYIAKFMADGLKRALPKLDTTGIRQHLEIILWERNHMKQTTVIDEEITRFLNEGKELDCKLRPEELDMKMREYANKRIRHRIERIPRIDREDTTGVIDDAVLSEESKMTLPWINQETQRILQNPDNTESRQEIEYKVRERINKRIRRDYIEMMERDSTIGAIDNVMNSEEMTLQEYTIAAIRQRSEMTLPKQAAAMVVHELERKLSFLIQEVGHTIHGGKVNIHMVESRTQMEIIRGIIKGELRKLSNLDNEELGLIYQYEPDRLLLTSNEERRTWSNFRGLCSSEWPAVLAIVDSDRIRRDNSNKSKWIAILLWSLYSTISRARVYCTVIVTNVACVKDSELDLMNFIFGKSKADVNVFKYPLHE